MRDGQRKDARVPLSEHFVERAFPHARGAGDDDRADVVRMSRYLELQQLANPLYSRVVERSFKWPGRREVMGKLHTWTHCEVAARDGVELRTERGAGESLE
jgi:hypothetical protein